MFFKRLSVTVLDYILKVTLPTIALKLQSCNFENFAEVKSG